MVLAAAWAAAAAAASCPATRTAPAPRAPLPQPPQAARQVTVAASVSAAVAGRSSADFGGVGVNMDFWPPNKPKWAAGGGGCGALDSDLRHPDLATLAGGLSGALLRLGGSPIDFLLYETPDTPLACDPAELNRTQPPPGAGFQPKTYFCPIWDQVNFAKSPGAHCLTAARWAEINRFALGAGLRVAFGLNACWLRAAHDQEMNWEYVDAMLRQTAQLAARNESAVWAWEFGNELYGNVAPERYGADMQRIAGAVEAEWARAEQGAGLQHGALRRPLLAGPDNGMDDMSSKYLGAMLSAANGTVFAATFHDYANPCVPSTPPPAGLVLNVSCFDARTAAAAAKFGPPASQNRVQLWYGEGAMHASSGVAGLTNVFRSSLWYAHKLAALPAAGIGILSRQTLLGGDYELINRTTARPNPDYYVALLWRRLVGAEAFTVEYDHTAAPGLRLHAAASARGGAERVVVAVNFHTSLAVSLSLPAAGGSEVWQLTGAPDADRTALNAQWGGGEVIYTPGSGQLPGLPPHNVTGGAVTLPPASVTWVRAQL